MHSNLEVHFSSASAEWATPDDLFAELNDIFHFDLDACASSENAKCSRYFTEQDDALRQHWAGTRLDEPPIRATDCGVHAQGVRRVAARFNRCMPGAQSDRHGLVASVCEARPGHLSPRPAEVRRSAACGAVHRRRS